MVPATRPLGQSYLSVTPQKPPVGIGVGGEGKGVCDIGLLFALTFVDTVHLQKISF